MIVDILFNEKSTKRALQFQKVRKTSVTRLDVMGVLLLEFNDYDFEAFPLYLVESFKVTND